MQTSAQKVIQDLTNRVQAEKEELEQLERERDLWKYNAQMNDKEALRGNERKKVCVYQIMQFLPQKYGLNTS